MKSALRLTIVFLSMGCATVLAYPIATTFTISPNQSNLTVDASSSFFSDTDTNSLSGTIDAVFDFGEGGAFPPAADITFTDAAIVPGGPYELRLGFPPFLGVDITASNLLAHLTTPAPPGAMTKTSAPGIVYQFDASQFLLTVDRGAIVVSGSTNETTDLSQEPVTGASPAGTFGTATFTMVGTNGPYTQLAAVLDLPIQIVDTAESESGGLSVELELSARIRANASFSVALSGTPADFDRDGDVDGDDLAQWGGDFGVNALSDADGDGDSDGQDFLGWQRQLGTSEPTVAAVELVPEPCVLTLASLAGCGWALGVTGNARRIVARRTSARLAFGTI